MGYNKKVITSIDVENVGDVLEYMWDYSGKQTFGAVGSYDTIADLLTMMLRYSEDDEFRIVSADIEPPEYDGYDSAYVLSVIGDEIDVSKAEWPGHNTFKDFGLDVVYVEKPYLHKFMKNNEPDELYYFEFGKDETNKSVPASDKCNFKMDEDNKGFSVKFADDDFTREFSYKTNKLLKADDINKILDFWWN